MRATIYLFLSLAFAIPAFADDVTVNAVLSGLPDPLPKRVVQYIRVVDVSTGEVVKSAKVKVANKLKIKIQRQPSILLIKHISLKKRDNRTGLAPLFKSGITQTKSVRTRIRMRKSGTAKLRNSQYAASHNAGPSQIRVGVPATGITVTGPGLHGGLSSGIASQIIGNISQNAPCYNASSGVVVIEVDPVVQAARRQEFDLCSSGSADPSTCVADNYTPPDHSVRGSVDSNGTTATVNLEFVGPDGEVIASETETGSPSEILEMIDRATKRLAHKMCAGRISFIESSCADTACVCCNTGPECLGHKWEQRFKVAARGPVGSKATFNLPIQYATTTCGNWSVGSCGTIPCCIREEGQTEDSVLDAVLPFPYIGPSCICPVMPPIPISFFIQLVSGNDVQEKERIVNCPQ